MDSAYADLAYHRSITMPSDSPGFTDAKLTDLSLILTDWGYGKTPVHCEATLKPYQLGDLLVAADKVAWDVVNGFADPCPSDSPDNTLSLWLLLSPKQGEPIGIKATWCEHGAFPPTDLQAFLTAVTQVESTVCGF